VVWRLQGLRSRDGLPPTLQTPLHPWIHVEVPDWTGEEVVQIGEKRLPLYSWCVIPSTEKPQNGGRTPSVLKALDHLREVLGSGGLQDNKSGRRRGYCGGKVANGL
jgi:hypothetical protein